MQRHHTTLGPTLELHTKLLGAHHRHPHIPPNQAQGHPPPIHSGGWVTGSGCLPDLPTQKNDTFW